MIVKCTGSQYKQFFDDEAYCFDQYFSVGMVGNKMIFCVNGFKP